MFVAAEIDNILNGTKAVVLTLVKNVLGLQVVQSGVTDVHQGDLHEIAVVNEAVHLFEAEPEEVAVDLKDLHLLLVQ